MSVIVTVLRSRNSITSLIGSPDHGVLEITSMAKYSYGLIILKMGLFWSMKMITKQ